MHWMRKECMGLLGIVSHLLIAGAADPTPVMEYKVQGPEKCIFNSYWLSFTQQDRQLGVCYSVRSAGSKAEMRLVIRDIGKKEDVLSLVLDKDHDGWIPGQSTPFLAGGKELIGIEQGDIRIYSADRKSMRASVHVLSSRVASQVWTNPASDAVLLAAEQPFNGLVVKRVPLPEKVMDTYRGEDLIRYESRRSYRLAASRDLSAVAVASTSLDDEHDIDFWDATRKKKLSTARTTMYATSIGMSPDGTSVAVGYPDGSVGFHDPKSGKCVHAVPPLGQVSVRSMSYHPKGEYVACGTYDRRGAPNLHILSASSGKVITTIAADTEAVLALCFDSGGDHLAVFTSSGKIKIYDARPLLKLQKE